MNLPLISIIIPVYNVGKYIDRCLLSVYNQSYSNIEILLIDDQGNDNSLNIINKHIEQCVSTSIRLIHHDENRGLAAARNTGIVHALGKYIYFLDGDDEITSDCIEKLVALAQNSGAELVQGNFRSEPDNWHGSVMNIKLLSAIENYKNKIGMLFLSRNIIPVMACNRLILREFLLKYKLFYREGIVHEDEYWNFTAVDYLKKLLVCKDFTYIYHKNNESISQSIIHAEKRKNSWMIILKDWVNSLKEPFFKDKLTKICNSSYDNYMQNDCRYFDIVEVLRPLKYTMLVMPFLRIGHFLCAKGIISISTQGKLVRACYKIIKMQSK